MTEQRQFRAIKGTRDILPPDSALWNWFEATARRVMESYGFREIRLPAIESLGLFARAIGGDTDIVGKEMYVFEDHSLDRLEGLRQGVISREVNLLNVMLATSFIADFQSFLGGAADALEAGELPKTHENQGALSELQAINQKLRFAIIPQEIGSVIHHDFENTARSAKSAIEKVALGDTVALRPEATASVVRAYIEHGMHVQPGLVKLYYIGPMFRRERPQKGRYRQFYQIGAEVLSPTGDAPAIDAELIEMLLHLFAEAGLEGCTLHINSIGCKDCRPKYVAELRAALEKVRDKLGPDSQRRIETNPLRVLDSKLPDEQPIIETLPRIADHLCDACRTHYAAVKHDLAQNRGIAFTENWRLVRGLDYYMRTTFEIIAPGLGSQNAVCGGGRYDGLIELLGGPPTKGIGFAIGTDRVILSLQAAGKVQATQLGLGVDVLVAWMGAAAYPTAVKLARKMRDTGFSVEVPPEDWKLKKSLGLADKLGARYALIIGENEVASGRYALKDLAAKEQRDLTEGELIEFLKGSEVRM